MTREPDRSAILAFSVAAGALLFLARGSYKANAFEDDFDMAGKDFRVDPNLLRGIAMTESSFNPAAISKPNSNGTVDYGLMQINGATAKKLGIVELSSLLQPRLSIRLAAELLSRLRLELGASFSIFTQIAAYNAGSPAILRRGIFNVSYVGTVLFHWQMFALGRLA